MRFSGRVFKFGRQWVIEVPILSVVTQGHTKKEAYEMIADAIEALVYKEGFKVNVHPGKGEYFEVSSKDQAAMTAFLLRRQRMKQGLSLAEVAKRLGAKSHNSYARYEQGKSVPTMEQLNKLLTAVSPKKDFVITESRNR
jgi:predicted RNase H-like HicB family nuclease/DNA-binding XRE family transcriptional regulator